MHNIFPVWLRKGDPQYVEALKTAIRGTLYGFDRLKRFGRKLRLYTETAIMLCLDFQRKKDSKYLEEHLRWLEKAWKEEKAGPMFASQNGKMYVAIRTCPDGIGGKCIMGSEVF